MFYDIHYLAHDADVYFGHKILDCIFDRRMNFSILPCDTSCPVGEISTRDKHYLLGFLIIYTVCFEDAKNIDKK